MKIMILFTIIGTDEKCATVSNVCWYQVGVTKFAASTGRTVAVASTPHIGYTRIMQWQELESKTGSETMVYIWGKRYIDDLILREKGTEKLYSLADPNWNVVATTNASGTVQERMKYDAFGKITWMNASFGTKTASGFAWNRTFTGQVLDAETGLMLYRNRYYHTDFGRFVSRDPIGYDAGDVNLMRYVGNIPNIRRDALGLQSIGEGFGFPPDFVPPPPVLPPPPPTPTSDGCPEGWKMVQKSPAVANGCGPAPTGAGRNLVRWLASIGQGIGGADFTPACDEHDLCWGDCDKDRKSCDDQFKKDMEDICRKKFPGKEFYLDRQWCLNAAKSFHSAVSGRTGTSIHGGARAKHCECVCDK
jgi:RHS repeat-associated protein